MTPSRSPAPPRKLLGIHLNDHLAASVATIEVARRCRRSNRGSALAGDLDRLVRDLVAERRQIEELLTTMGLPRTRFKQVAAYAAERLGRLRLNGQLRGYSPLSRLVELEGLCVMVELKRNLWRSLERVADVDPAFASVDFGALLSHAERHRATLEGHRLEAAELAFRGSTAPPDAA